MLVPSTYPHSQGQSDAVRISKRPSPNRNGGFRPDSVTLDLGLAQDRTFGSAPNPVIQMVLTTSRKRTLSAAIGNWHKGYLEKNARGQIQLDTKLRHVRYAAMPPSLRRVFDMVLSKNFIVKTYGVSQRNPMCES